MVSIDLTEQDEKVGRFRQKRLYQKSAQSVAAKTGRLAIRKVLGNFPKGKQVGISTGENVRRQASEIG
jgi:hypothetical protein